VVSSDNWTSIHPLFQDETSNLEAEREKMLARIGGYRPPETIFEVNNRRMGKHENVNALDTIKRVRTTLESKKKRAQANEKPDFLEDASDDEKAANEAEDNQNEGAFSDEDDDVPTGVADNMSMASDSELEVTFSSYSQSKDNKAKKASAASFQNPEYFMSYTPNNNSLAEDRAYGVHSGTNSNFAQASRSATMDLAGDDGGRGFGEARTLMRWDKRHKKYVARQNDEDGSKGTRLVRGESGAKIAASFRSGRFDAWKRGNRLGRLPRVGEAEAPNLTAGLNSAISGKRFRHRKEQAPKRADPLRGDYEKMKKKAELAKERSMSKAGGAAPRGKSELKGTDDIRIARKLKQKRQEKNARPSRKK
jgi:ATP-dependent RNA helicase DDX54/DBP10